jgi:hypothetical protein
MKTTHQKSSERNNPSTKIPKDKAPAQNRSDAADDLEQNEQKSADDISYSEQLNVTPPNPHPFPSVGIAETDFVTRNHGRSTGRMIDHEPGI